MIPEKRLALFGSIATQALNSGCSFQIQGGQFGGRYEDSGGLQNVEHSNSFSDFIQLPSL